MDTETGPRRRHRLRARVGPATGQRVQGTLADVQRLVVGASPVAGVLPEALIDAMRDRREAMTVALEPLVTDTMRVVARREAELLGEVLAPTIGAAVRKAVSAALAAIMQRFNEALERSMSLRSLQWRLEAKRTGRPFAEVVLVNTLIYRVEQLFLFHVPTGLVLQHLVAEGIPANDPDQVSAMLSAIDAFSREALQEPGSHLREVALGDLNLWVDWDQGIALAAVIRGSAPRSYLEVIRETRERVYLDQREQLAKFVNDVTPFERTRPTLQECLLEQRREPARRGQVVLACLAAFAFLLILAAWARAHQHHTHDAQLLQAYHQALESEPGLVVTSAVVTRGVFRVVGLRDPLAPDPATVIARAGLAPADVQFTPFASLAPQIVAERTRHALRPPDGVTVDARGSTLVLSGEAPRAWIAQALVIAGVLSGGARVDHEALRASEDLLAIRSIAALLEEQRVAFSPTSARLDANASRASAAAATLVHSLRERAEAAFVPMCVIAVGNTDPSGSEELNRALAQERAVSVANALADHGSAPDIWTAASGDKNAGVREVRFITHERTYPTPCGGAP